MRSPVFVSTSDIDFEPVARARGPGPLNDLFFTTPRPGRVTLAPCPGHVLGNPIRDATLEKTRESKICSSMLSYGHSGDLGRHEDE